jgi:hypothetical protein
MTPTELDDAIERVAYWVALGAKRALADSPHDAALLLVSDLAASVKEVLFEDRRSAGGNRPKPVPPVNP